MKTIPLNAGSLVLRTDFSDDRSWGSICEEIEQEVDGFRAYVDFVSDREFEGLSVEQASTLLERGKTGEYRWFFFIVDKTTLSEPEHPVLVVDLEDEPGRTFRVIPTLINVVENNLSTANMGFAEFADAADSDGIFRKI